MIKVYNARMQNFMKMLRKNKFSYAKIAKIVHCDRVTVMRYCTVYASSRQVKRGITDETNN